MRLIRALLLVVIVFCLMPGLHSLAIARETWTEIGYVQILEGPEKIWLFVEVLRITDFSDEILADLMSTHPQKERLSQSVFTIDARGNTTEQVVSSKSGPTFHPNLSRIFRPSRGFYLYHFPAMNRPASLYQWRGDHFGRLAEDESDEVRKAIAPFERLEPQLRVIEGLDDLTAKTGWRCMTDDVFMFNKVAQPFVSDNHQIKIRVAFTTSRGSPPAGLKFLTKSLGLVEAERPTAVVAESLSKTKPWTKTLIKVETQIEKTKPWTKRRQKPT